MSDRTNQVIRKLLHISVVGFGFTLALALTVLSIEQIAEVVIAPLLLPKDVATIVAAGALLAALIPFGYMIVHAGIFFRIIAMKLFR